MSALAYNNTHVSAHTHLLLCCFHCCFSSALSAEASPFSGINSNVLRRQTSASPCSSRGPSYGGASSEVESGALAKVRCRVFLVEQALPREWGQGSLCWSRLAGVVCFVTGDVDEA